MYSLAFLFSVLKPQRFHKLPAQVEFALLQVEQCLNVAAVTTSFEPHEARNMLELMVGVLGLLQPKQ